MYYIFHGEDEFSRTEQVKKLKAQMGDPQFADLNISVFDGRTVTLGELQHACDSAPFLGERRLVIVEGLLARLEPQRKKGGEDARRGGEEAGEEGSGETNAELAKGLKEYLERLPETTRLVFVDSKALAKNNPVLKYAEEDKDKKRVHVKEFRLLDDRDLPEWIEDHVQAKGGAIEPAAARELAACVGGDLRLLSNELEKLQAYTGSGPIRIADVQALVAAVRESSIFDLVDAIGERKTTRALERLHAHLDQNAAPLYLLSMIERQFRIILQVKDLGERGMMTAMIAERTHLKPFIVEKTARQTRNFSIPQLEAIYRKLLETDLAIKTSRSDPVVALDTLILELTKM